MTGKKDVYSVEEAVAFLKQSDEIDREKKRREDAEKEAQKKAEEDAAKGIVPKKGEDQEEEEQDISIISAVSGGSVTSATSVTSTRSQHRAKRVDPKKRCVEYMGTWLVGMDQVKKGDFVEVRDGQNITVLKVTTFENAVGEAIIGGIYFRCAGVQVITTEIKDEGEKKGDPEPTKPTKRTKTKTKPDPLKTKKETLICFVDTGVFWDYPPSDLMTRLDPPKLYDISSKRKLYWFPQILVKYLGNVTYSTLDPGC